MAEAVQDPLARLVLQTYQGELQRSIHQPDRLAAVYGSYFASRPQDERLNAIVQTAAQLTAAPHAALVLLTASEGRVVAAYDGEVRRSSDLLCVWDTKPRQWSKIQIEVLTQLAAQAMQLDEAFSAARAHQAAQET
jgi:GAF domain-containing protein